MICTLCERDFSLEAISEGVPIPCPGHTLMYRFQDGRVHQFRVREKPQVIEGVFVQTRQIKPAVAPAVDTIIDTTEPSVTDISPEIAPEISLDSAAARLEKQWHNPAPKETTPDNLTTEYSEEFVGPELKVGDVLDLIVVSWSLIDPRGLNRPGQGLARPQGVREKGRRDGFYFNQASVISEGVETLRPGSRIHGRLAEAISLAHPFTVVDIEIYQK